MAPESKKILIIDDDSRNIFALKAVLKSRGFNCLTASAASEGIRELRSKPDIGIVLLDMMMPDMDGYEAITAIRKEHARIAVVSVTAQAMTGDRERCIDAGADDYISKPIDVDLLMGILNKYLQ
jgi:two-component system, cell cycle response regulator DivK